VVLAYDFGKNLYAIFPSVGVERGGGGRIY